MEFANNGDLFEKVTTLRKSHTHLPETEIWNIFIQIVKGLSGLHELGIVHRDIKVQTSATLPSR